VIRETGRVEPGPAAVAVYEGGHEVFQALYPALQRVFTGC
jgi:hypothetical protein